MNLMDLLSGDPAVVQQEQEFTSFNSFYGNSPDTPTAPPQEEPNPSMVYYIPTEMTQLQKDMSEAVVQMFASTLLTELFPKKSRSNISSLLLAPDDDHGTHDRAKLVSLIYNQLLTICMHPSLVVDHFISKELLLLSTKARLCNLSGKVMVFDRIIDVISEKYELDMPQQDYNLLVIAKSIKELELIEGLVIGKKLRYRNISNGRSLYEEPPALSRVEKDEFPDDEQSAEYKHRHQHFAARRAGKNKPVAKEFVLHLITSNHLCLSFASDLKFDLMVSFDINLDLSSPGVELLRRNVDFDATTTSQVQIPILVPVPVYSVEHILRMVPQPESELGNLSRDAEADWRRRILSVFIANRYHIYEDFSEKFICSNYGKGLSCLHNLIFEWGNVPPSLPYKWMDRYTAKLSIDTSGEMIKERLEANLLLSLSRIFSDHANGCNSAAHAKVEGDPVSEFTGFKQHMARFLNARIAQVETLKTDALENIIPKLREKEARRQQEIDKDEEQVGENYRKLRKLNEEVADIDKRFNRVENENQKLQESVNEAQQMLDHLDDVLRNKSDEDITQIMAEQDSLLEQLEKEKNVLSEECRTLGEEIEVAREEYQEKSIQALQITEELQALKDKEALLQKKIDGPGMLVLPSLARKEELSTYELRLRRLTRANDFLSELFVLRFDKLVKDRNLMMESAAPAPGTRQNNRVSRAPTPL